MIVNNAEQRMPDIVDDDIGAFCSIPRFASRKEPHTSIFDLNPPLSDAQRYIRAMSLAAQQHPNAFGFANGFGRDERMAAYERVVKKPDFNTLVYEMDGTIVGAVSYARPVTGVLEVGFLFAHKEYAGLAIGRMLLRSALHITAARGESIVTLEVRADNEGALRLYRSIGFCEVGDDLDDPTDAIEMRLVGRQNIQAAIVELTRQIIEASQLGGLDRLIQRPPKDEVEDSNQA